MSSQKRKPIANCLSFFQKSNSSDDEWENSLSIYQQNVTSGGCPMIYPNHVNETFKCYCCERSPFFKYFSVLFCCYNPNQARVRVVYSLAVSTQIV